MIVISILHLVFFVLGLAFGFAVGKRRAKIPVAKFSVVGKNTDHTVSMPYDPKDKTGVQLIAALASQEIGNFVPMRHWYASHFPEMHQHEQRASAPDAASGEPA
jgi:hypothetical protein